VLDASIRVVAGASAQCLEKVSGGVAVDRRTAAAVASG
jgi:hypothetical protein